MFCLFFSIKPIDNIKSLETNIIYVDDNYNNSTNGWLEDHFNNIQDAVNKSKNNDIIYIKNGIYKENLVIYKSVSLIGEKNNLTIIDGCYKLDTIKITANNVKLKNLFIKNSGNDSKDSGIKILSNLNILDNNKIKNNSIGILLYDCSKNVIKKNNISSNIYGIGVENCKSSNNISNNIIHNNNLSGIYLSYTINNNICKNLIFNNKFGIALSFSDNNIIIENSIKNNLNDGFNIYKSDKNEFSKNKIITSYNGYIIINSKSNNINQNTIKNINNIGIFLYKNNSDTIIQNNIIENSSIGINISYDSKNNQIDNNFFSNVNQKIILIKEKIDKNKPQIEVIIGLIIINSILLYLIYIKILKKTKK